MCEIVKLNNFKKILNIFQLQILSDSWNTFSIIQ